MESNLEDNIKSINDELSETISDKSLYLAECARQRIQQCCHSFDERLDHYLKVIESSELSSRDLTRMGHSLKSLSKLVTTSCKELTNILNKYKKNLFKSD